MVALYKQGLSCKAIGKKLTCSPQSVANWLSRLGAEVRTPSQTRLITYPHYEIECKVCSRCDGNKPIDRFSRCKESLDGHEGVCKDCTNERRRSQYPEVMERVCEEQRQRRREDPQRFRGYDLKKRFKLTTEEHEKIFDDQGRKCAGCGSLESGEPTGYWHTDHDHACCPGRRRTCGKCIRGILCRSCNLTLGNAKDSVTRLRSLANYLENFNTSTRPPETEKRATQPRYFEEIATGYIRP